MCLKLNNELFVKIKSLTLTNLDKCLKVIIIKDKKGQRGGNMRISDTVADYILRLLEEADGTAEIQRNELANNIGCVPSQINYVITSRFTPEQGYIVESRRGGGGYIRITRRQMTKADMIMHIINSVGQELDAGSCRAMIVNMNQSGVIDEKTAKYISAATADNTLSAVPREIRDKVRCSIFKNILLVAD